VSGASRNSIIVVCMTTMVVSGCGRSPDRPTTEQRGSPALSVASHGARNPATAAKKVLRAISRDDLDAANALASSDRTYCRDTGNTFNLPTVGRKDRIRATTRYIDHTWHVQLVVGDSYGQSYASFVVVRGSDRRYYVC
jgi:hypothetical protein